MQVKLIAQGTQEGSLEDALAVVANTGTFDELYVAVAYATKQGLLTLQAALGGIPAKSRWVVGLDDAITQPEALNYLMALPGAKLRLAKLSPERRFHPKLYCLKQTQDNDVAVSAIGSGNMTLRGLRHNGEAAVLLTAESSEDAAAMRAQWRTLWSLGEDATQSMIQTYAGTYKQATKQRAKVVELGVAPPEPEPDAPVPAAAVFDGSPANATVAWTEGASPSAGGRDLEFPRAMMPFFRLDETPVDKRFRMANGQVFSLTFTMRPDNQMWRLLFSRDAIFAGIGRENLRPLAGTSNRSDLTIVFERSGNGADYNVQLVPIGSAPYDTLVERSKATGIIERTRNPGGRNFGYY